MHRRDELRAIKSAAGSRLANEKIRLSGDSVVESIHGDERKVTGVPFQECQDR